MRRVGWPRSTRRARRRRRGGAEARRRRLGDKNSASLCAAPLSLSRARESRSVAEGPGEAPLATKRSRLARRAEPTVRGTPFTQRACAHVAISPACSWRVVFVLLVRPQEFVPALQTFSVLDAVTAITALGVVVEVALGKQKKPLEPADPLARRLPSPGCFLVTVRRRGLAGFAVAWAGAVLATAIMAGSSASFKQRECRHA